jgi:hypothetical protein
MSSDPLPRNACDGLTDPLPKITCDALMDSTRHIMLTHAEVGYKEAHAANYDSGIYSHFPRTLKVFLPPHLHPASLSGFHCLRVRSSTINCPSTLSLPFRPDPKHVFLNPHPQRLPQHGQVTRRLRLD